MSESTMPGLTTTALLGELHKQGIKADLIGEHRAAVRFCSLRAPEDRGIYYATSEAGELPAMVGAIIICDGRRQDVDLTLNSLLVTEHPQRAFYVLQRVHHIPQPKTGIHQTAIVSDDAVVSPSAYIGPYCVIGHAIVGANCVLESHVVLRDDVVLEDGVTVESHSTLGATGVAWVWDETNCKRIVQPQTGGVRIGENTFIGTDVTVVRGSINEITTIGANCLIAHGTKIGHGCAVGDLVHFANNVTVAGSVTIGRESFLSSGCVTRPRITLPRGTTVGAGAVVVSSPEHEYLTLVGVPAKPLVQSEGRMTGVPVRTRPSKSPRAQ